ncbi:MAG: hypothetical protein JWS10_1931 [Cypionkella sp.]|uniref:hypothetical protein n=1 Tax=Cypionkella sp. TaxID=2811411 RepID=UPI0026184CB4|nr:hypothetical protein [Cypionkella sp.]MDB5659316.1 hypothetical protein [Cypionkella sp.]MDB5666171.1 hypothetical protein [Cypionkella sp.]
MQIERLMDEMHTAIVTADFDGLGRLSPKLDAALESLPKRMDQKLLQRLQRKAERNASSAAAAAKGVRAAIRRLNDVKQNAIALVTYDENGQRATHGGQQEIQRRF